jgi:hypothetical protein
MLAGACPLLEAAGQGPVSCRFVPADATIAELEKKASDHEQKAAKAEEPLAAELRREAKLCWEWAAALRSGRWTS